MKPSLHFVELPGGRYSADQDDDGKWNVRDVPFFAELPAGVRQNEKPIGREWLERAIERSRELEVGQNHLAPVHANHHSNGKDTFRIGFLRPVRVGQVRLDGRDRWALFGDIVGIEPHHYDQLRAVRFPYRSAEIPGSWRPEVSSLALSEDEPPHFKFPMLTIGEETPHPEPVVNSFSEEDAPALCFSDVGDSRWVTFGFEGVDDMAKEKEEKKVKFQEEEEKKEGEGNEKEEMQEEDKTASAIAKVIADFQAKLPELVKSILEGMIPSGVRSDEGEQAVEPAAMNEEQLKMFSELSTKVAGLEEKERQRSSTQQIEDLVESASAKLSEDGWHVSDSHRGEMRKMAEASKDPRQGVEVYAESFRANVPKDPARNLDEIAAQEFSESEELVEFTSRSPEEFGAAKILSRDYDRLVAAGCHLETPKKDFIEINLESLKKESASA